ncbi:MAG: glycosyltransferase family 2 protein, partial [Cyanobacteria bacterium J06607_13]
IIQLGFLDGYAGYVYGRLLSQYEYQIGVKLYELKFGGRLNKLAPDAPSVATVEPSAQPSAEQALEQTT